MGKKSIWKILKWSLELCFECSNAQTVNSKMLNATSAYMYFPVIKSSHVNVNTPVEEHFASARWVLFLCDITSRHGNKWCIAAACSRVESVCDILWGKGKWAKLQPFCVHQSKKCLHVVIREPDKSQVVLFCVFFCHKNRCIGDECINWYYGGERRGYLKFWTKSQKIVCVMYYFVIGTFIIIALRTACCILHSTATWIVL